MRTKYIAIERPEYHITAVTPEVLASIAARPDVHGAITKQYAITVASIKKQCIRIIDDVSYIDNITRHQDFTAKYHGKTHTATVNWFSSDGTGMITTHDGNVRLPIYACNITGKKTWFPETACVYYKEGQHVDVRIDVLGFGQVFAIGITPGYFDETKWNCIKDQNLAFRCNDVGEATNGLFE